MKIGKLALACAIACALQGGRLYAQQPTGDQNNQGLNYPAGRLVGYEYTKYYAPTDGASPSDATATPEAAATVVPAEEKAAAPAEVVAEEEADEWVPKHILGNVPFLKKRGIEVGGWIAQGFVANPQSPQDIKTLFARFLDARQEVVGGTPLTDRQKQELYDQFQQWQSGHSR